MNRNSNIGGKTYNDVTKLKSKININSISSVSKNAKWLLLNDHHQSLPLWWKKYYVTFMLIRWNLPQCFRFLFFSKFIRDKTTRLPATTRIFYDKKSMWKVKLWAENTDSQHCHNPFARLKKVQKNLIKHKKSHLNVLRLTDRVDSDRSQFCYFKNCSAVVFCCFCTTSSTTLKSYKTLEKNLKINQLIKEKLTASEDQTNGFFEDLDN